MTTPQIRILGLWKIATPDAQERIPTRATILRLILPLRRTLIFRQALHRPTETLAPVMRATRPCPFQLDPLCGCQHLADLC